MAAGVSRAVRVGQLAEDQPAFRRARGLLRVFCPPQLLADRRGLAPAFPSSAAGRLLPACGSPSRPPVFLTPAHD